MIDTAKHESEELPGFLRDQFDDEPTRQRVAFDWVFAVTLPVVCLIFDPIVFSDGGVFSSLRVFGYLAIGFGMLSFVVWRLWSNLSRWPAGILGGCMIGGFVFSLGLGVLLFPLSVAGIMMLIGVLGLTPLFTSFSLLRNGVLAARAAKLSRSCTRLSVCLGIALFFIASAGPQWGANRVAANAMRRILNGSDADRSDAIATLKLLRPVANLDTIVFAWEKELDDVRKSALASAYEELTGTSVDDRLTRLRD